jgi:hypothetical protein
MEHEPNTILMVFPDEHQTQAEHFVIALRQRFGEISPDEASHRRGRSIVVGDLAELRGSSINRSTVCLASENNIRQSEDLPHRT